MIGKTISHYRILEKLGEGGMGVVYKAEDTKLERIVAIKFLPHHIAANAEERERFKIEAKAAAALNHPNIATIYAIEEIDGDMFIVMEFIDGKEIRQLIIDNSQLSMINCLAYATQIAEGLKAAHAKGITHRDIKSSNIMVTESGQVKIMDFGLAKIGAGAHLTKSGTTLGTVAYMSPEQARGEEIDHRTDIWSFGVVLYEMLTGQLPFRGVYEAAIMYSILNEEPQPVSSLRAEVPMALERVVEKALAKALPKRFDSVQSMIQDLQNARASISSPPIISPAPTPAPRKDSQETPSDQLRKAERRQATIFISHLAGYTDLIEQLAPEEVEAVMSQIRDSAAAIVQTHGGVINQFAGDEMAALFGIPTSHEDDFVRAVRAALALHAQVRELSREIKRRIGQEIRLQSGINTGVIVAQLRGEGERKYEITGSAFQIAALLAAQAEAGEILVGPEHQRLIAPFFETEACAPVALKGKAQSITPYRVRGESGLQTRLEAAERVGLTPFTGREQELKTLQACLEKARRGEGQFVAVVGEAGAGKSRLLFELRRELDRETIKLVQGRCQAHGGNIPYLPFVESLKNILRLRENDSPASLLETAVAGICAIDSNLKDFMPFYLHLLSIPSEAHPLPKHLQGEDFRLAILEGLCAIFTLSATRGPIVMLLEDWHWADEASHEILKQIAEMVSAYSLLVVATYRPEGSLDWNNLSYHTLIHLGPLEVSSSLRIMKAVLGAENFPEELGKRIHERTGGNPFFLEEICQTLVEEGTLKVEQGQAIPAGSWEKLHLPDTVEAVIRTRLDRLDHEAKELLCLAAVVGREFNRGILQRTLADDAHLLRSLETLKALGLIQQISVRPEATYKFKHALTQEVAYESLLQHQRKSLHGLVGKTIEALYPDRIEEHSEALAHHFNNAENWQKAVYYGCKVADDLMMKSFSIVLNILERVEHWVSKLPENQERKAILINVLLKMERTCENLGYVKRQKQIIDRLLTLIESDDINRAEVHIRLGDLFILSNQLEEAENALKEAYRLSKELDHEDTELRVLRSMGYLKVHSGRDDEAVSIIRKVIEMSIQKSIADVLVQDLNSLFTILIRLGDYDGAKKCVDDALDLYDQVPLRHRAYINFMAGNYYRHMGEYDKAISYLTTMVQLFEGYGYGGKPTTAFLPLAHIYLIRGNVEEALRCYEKAVEMSRTRKIASELAIALNAMGTALLSLGRNTESLPHLEEAAMVFSQLEDSENETQVLCTIANILEKVGRYDDAFATWEKVRKMGEEAGDLRVKLNAVKGMASTTRHLADDSSHALKYYTEADKLAQELEDLDEQGEILNTMGIIAWQSGHYEQALHHYEKALAIFLEKDDKKHAGFILNSMASTLIKLNRHEQALTCLDEAMQFHKQADQLLLEGHALAMRGDIYFELQELNRAQQNYENSLELRQKIGDRKGEGWMSLQLAKVFEAQGLAAKNRAYADGALAIAKECDDRSFLDEVQAYLQRFSEQTNSIKNHS